MYGFLLSTLEYAMPFMDDVTEIVHVSPGTDKRANSNSRDAKCKRTELLLTTDWGSANFHTEIAQTNLQLECARIRSAPEQLN